MTDDGGQPPGFLEAQRRRGNIFAFRRVKWADPSPKLSMGKFPGADAPRRGKVWGIPLFLVAAIAISVGGYLVVSLLPF